MQGVHEPTNAPIETNRNLTQMGISVTIRLLVNTTNQICQRNQSDRNVGIRRREKVGSVTNWPLTSDLTVDVGG